MAIDIKKYMSDLVRQLNLRHMDGPTRAQLADWKKKGVATSKQAGWDPDAELPKFDDVDYRDSSSGSIRDDLISLQKQLVLLGRDLTADSSLEDNKDVQKFLDEFYGDGKAIPLFEIEPIPEAKEIAHYINKYARKLETALNLKQDDLYKLATALLSGSYTKDSKVQKTLDDFLTGMRGAVGSRNGLLSGTKLPDAWVSSTEVDKQYADEIVKYLEANEKTITGILGMDPWFNTSKIPVVISNLKKKRRASDVAEVLSWLERAPIETWPTKDLPASWASSKGGFSERKIEKLREEAAKAGTVNFERLGEIQDKLKKPVINVNPKLVGFAKPTPRDGQVSEILERIISKDKLRDAVTARGGDIAKWIKGGLDESNYKDGDDKVGQKFTDRKRFFARAESAVKGYFSDTWDKLGNKHKRHIYQTKANLVVEGLLKEKVKPTDGLGKVLEKLDGISAKQTVPVQKQIKWMKEKLGAMSNTTQFKEALTHGGQMQQIVNDIVAAVKSDSDMESAKMTLETLAVMSSSMTTSGVREELHKMDFTIFSDPSMSFNKGGLGILTKAVDKTLRFATLAVYEAGNFVANAIKKSGGRIKKDKLKSAAESEGTELSDDEMRRAELMAFWNFVNSGANTDLNVFKRHSVKQKAADAKATLKDEHGNPTDEIKFKMGGREVVRKNPTVKDVELIEYMIKQKMAERA